MTLLNEAKAIYVGDLKADAVYAGVTNVWSRPATDGLLAHWTFDDGTATDSSGNEYHGVLVGGPAPIAGKFGGALAFNGSGQYVTTPLVQPSTTAYSVCAWFSTNSGFAQFITNNRGPDGTGISVDLAMNNNTYNEVDVFINANNLITGIYCTAASVGDDFCTGAWRHLVGVFDCPNGTTVEPSHFTLYLDGQQLTPDGTFSYQSTTSPIAGDSSGTVIGGSLYPGSPSFNGSLDDIWIFNRALSAAEVLSLFSSGQPDPRQYHLISSFTPEGYRQDFTGIVGSIFTASTDQSFNRIGALCGPGSNGVHQAEFGLWNAGNLQPLFQASIDFSGGVVGKFIYVGVDQFSITAGEQYYICMHTVAGDSSPWSNVGDVTLNNASGVFSFYSDDYTVGHLTAADKMYFGVDIGYVP